ncbi:MAG: zinc ribbon domain-containing protein [Gemmatirosa sp.]|nr:zinc ribbon domain-containing protein [Gemmatirosa sp.]
MLVLPDGVLALGAGTVLALGAAAVVLGPLLQDDEPARRPAPTPAPPASAQRSAAVDALREIEFDRATGKLSDDDYDALKASYTRDALAEMRARDAVGAGAGTDVADDPLERVIRGYRAGARAVCPVDGPRPEPDAAFCSACGRFLAGRCASCGAACDQEGQRFCGDCGHALAA